MGIKVFLLSALRQPQVSFISLDYISHSTSPPFFLTLPFDLRQKKKLSFVGLHTISLVACLDLIPSFFSSNPLIFFSSAFLWHPSGGWLRICGLPALSCSQMRNCAKEEVLIVFSGRWLL